jgi:hypothetical protein
MTDKRGQSTEDAAPETHEEAEKNILHDPALTALDHEDAATDDDARTSDTAHSGETQGS